MRKPIPTLLETKELPPFQYLGLDKIRVPVTADDFDAAVAHIKSAKIVGFDTESKPVFKKGAFNDGPHLVQFACEDRAYLFQLNNPESHNPLLYLLAAEDIKKIGFDLASDRKLLLKKFGILPRGFIDLCPVFKKQGYKNTVGVRAAIAIVFSQQFHKSKHTSTSNWDNDKLSEAQLIYAANDAYAALCVYLKLFNNTTNTTIKLNEPTQLSIDD